MKKCKYLNTDDVKVIENTLSRYISYTDSPVKGASFLFPSGNFFNLDIHDEIRDTIIKQHLTDDIGDAIIAKENNLYADLDRLGVIRLNNSDGLFTDGVKAFDMPIYAVLSEHIRPTTYQKRSLVEWLYLVISSKAEEGRKVIFILGDNGKKEELVDLYRETPEEVIDFLIRSWYSVRRS